MSPKTTSSTWAMVGCLLLRNSINCTSQETMSAHAAGPTQGQAHMTNFDSSFGVFSPTAS